MEEPDDPAERPSVAEWILDSPEAAAEPGEASEQAGKASANKAGEASAKAGEASAKAGEASAKAGEASAKAGKASAKAGKAAAKPVVVAKRRPPAMVVPGTDGAEGAGKNKTARFSGPHQAHIDVCFYAVSGCLSTLYYLNEQCSCKRLKMLYLYISCRAGHKTKPNTHSMGFVIGPSANCLMRMIRYRCGLFLLLLPPLIWYLEILGNRYRVRVARFSPFPQMISQLRLPQMISQLRRQREASIFFTPWM